MARLRMLRDGVHRLAPTVGYLAQDAAQVSRDRDVRLDWRKWYKTARWQRLRWSVLLRDLFTCQMCGHAEADTSLLVADHIAAHRGDEALFWDDGNLQCLCKTCHDGEKQREEARGFTARPDWLPRSAVPVTIVCGPPMAGKSSHVAQHAGPDDVVIDLDQIACALAGIAFTHGWSRDRWLGPAIRRRNAMLADLSREDRAVSAWLIVSAPSSDERRWWADKLGGTVVLLDVPKDECLRRLAASMDRDVERTTSGIRAWWAAARRARGTGPEA